MKKDEIGKSLGLTPLPEVIPVSQANKPIVAKDDQADEKEYQYAR